MGELLSSLDVVNKAFKRTMRGYDPAEVDEFLDRVAESIQAYVQQTKEFERVMEDQSEKLKDYEKIKGSLHEALLMAQRTAEEKVANAIKASEDKLTSASTAADDIIAGARLQAERMMQEAESAVAQHGEELRKLQQIRDAAFAQMRQFSADIRGVIDGAESSGVIQIPEFTQEMMRRNPDGRIQLSSRPSRSSAPTPDGWSSAIPFTNPEPAVEEERKLDISETLNVLGIDPSLLNVDTGSM